MSVTGPRIERDEDDHPVWIHYCSDGVPDFDGETRATLPLGGSKGWTWTENGGLEPSIHCLNCGTHGFWVGGDAPRWRSC